MNRFLLEAFLQVIILVPFAILAANKKSKENFLRIFFFALIYIIYQLILVLPKLSSALNFIGGNWNWEGKLFGIIWGIICYFIFRKYFSENDFFTFKQDRNGFKTALIATIISVLLVTAIAYLTGEDKFNVETLAFQLTMPAIDEEIMFRGILLGLLMTALRDKISFLGNPAILLTAILFGFIHALTLEKDFSVNFEPIYFLHTGIGGFVFGWITVKSRSILLAVLAHGLANFLAALATMIK